MLKKILVRPQTAETAMGAAIIAASGCWFSSLRQASSQMVNIAQTVDPNPGWASAFEEKYQTFLAELKDREYIE